MGGNHHQSGQGTWFHPSIYMVQQSPRLSLNLDIINDVLPMKYLRLTMNRSHSLFLVCHILIVPSLSQPGLFIRRLLYMSGNMSSVEDEDFTFGFSRLDLIREDEIGRREEYKHAEHDPDISITRSVGIFLSDPGETHLHLYE